MTQTTPTNEALIKEYYATHANDLFFKCPLMHGNPMRKSICLKRQDLANRKYGSKFNHPGDHNAVTLETCRICNVGKQMLEGRV